MLNNLILLNNTLPNTLTINHLLNILLNTQPLWLTYLKVKLIIMVINNQPKS